MKKITQIIWGLAIVALGVIFAGNALGWFNIDIFFKGWWTLFIIVPSFINIFTEEHKVPSFVFMCAGILLLLAAQEVFTYEVAWKVILAIVLVVIGLSIIFKNIFHSKNDKEVAAKIKKIKNGDTMDNQTAVFSGSERTYKKETFSGTSLVAVFGGVDLDLRDAIFEKDTVIRAVCAFGGIDLKVPEDVQIKLNSNIVFGGISDDRKNPNESSKHTIYIDAYGAFGGISINDKDDD